MPDLSDQIAVAKSKVFEAEQHIHNFRTHVDPQGWRAIKAYVDSAIAYQMLLSQKEAVHA